MRQANVDFPESERFVIQRRLGAGGMGVVYQAYDQQRRTTVALKALKQLDANSLYQFKNEFRALADIHHPNIVRLGELICERGQWFFTMELVEGVDFLDHVRSPPRSPGLAFNEPRLRAALTQLARGLAALHAAGKIHRDVKPSNIRVTPQGRVVLLDFGLVIEADPDLNPTTQNISGTPMYMAPEQVTPRALGPEADWYAMGVLLYEALTAELPFHGTFLEILSTKQEREPQPPRGLVPGVPEDLDALCSELLRVDPTRRPRDAEVLVRLSAGGEERLPPQPVLAPTAPFIGRDAELDALRRCFEQAERGRPIAAFVLGVSGIGKSALVRRFTDQVEGQRLSALCLSSRCYEQETVPFKALDGIVDALALALRRMDQVEVAFLLPREATALARLFPVLLRVPALARVIQPQGEGAGSATVRSRAFAAFRELFSRLSERFRLVLAIDDFQWSDTDSLELLAELMHPPDAPRLLLAMTVRVDSVGDRLPPQLEALVPSLGEVHRLSLEGLPFDESIRLAQGWAGDSTAREQLATVAREAGGHPLFIQELMRHSLSAAAGEAPVRLDDALWARVSALAPAARRLIEVLSVAGTALPPSVAARAAGLGEEELARWVAALRAEHLVHARGGTAAGAVEPYHDRVRESVKARLAPLAIREHHQRIAAALEATADPLAHAPELTFHLEGAGDLARSAWYAQEGARRAREILAFDLAAELYRTALRIGRPGDEERRALQMRLGEVLALAGRGLKAAEAYLAAAPGADATTRLDCQRCAAEHLLGSGHYERGLEVLSSVLTELGMRLPRTQNAALGSLFWQRARMGLRRLRWREHAASEVRPRDLTVIDTMRAVGMALWPVDQFRGVGFITRSQLLALKAGERRRVAVAIALEAIYCGQMGDARRARERATEALRVSQPLKDARLTSLITGYEGAAMYCIGRFREAAEKIGQVEVHRDPTVITAWQLNVFRMMRLWSLRDCGAYAELALRFDEYMRDAVRRGDRYAQCNFTRVCSTVFLIRDQPAQALEAIARTPWAPSEGGFHFQTWFELIARINIALYEGPRGGLREQSRRTLRSIPLPMMQAMQTARARTFAQRGRLALSDAEAGQDREDALREALAMAKKLDRERVAYASVWSLLLRAGVERQRGDDGRAFALLRDAVSAADAQGMQQYAAAARYRLGELLGGDEGAALRAQAEQALAGEGVLRPARMCQVLAPGMSA